MKAPSFTPAAAGSCDLPYGTGRLEVAVFEDTAAAAASGVCGCVEAAEEAVRTLNRYQTGGHMLQLAPDGIRVSDSRGGAEARAAFVFDWQFD